MSPASHSPVPRPRAPRSWLRRVFRRGPWENAATAAIAIGVVMMMQPFWLWAYSSSFGVILAGTVGFIVVSKFPE
jgi:hypothetical protein